MGTTTVADALFSKVQQRVLALLFGDPDRSFYANQVIAHVGSGSGAVQRELARLTGAGLLTVIRIGRQTHYQANAASPVFAELRSIVRKTSGPTDLLCAALAPLTSDIRAAFVFGSVARGDDTAASDVDLLVVSDTLGYPELFAVLEHAARDLGRSVNPTVYSATELARRLTDGNAFVTRVVAGPKLWLIGGDDDLSAR